MAESVTPEERKALLDEYASLRGSPTGKRLREIERLLGLGKFASSERRAKGA